MNEFDTTTTLPAQLQWLTGLVPAALVVVVVTVLLVVVWCGYRAAGARGWTARTWLSADATGREHERVAARIRRTWPALAKEWRMSRRRPGLTAAERWLRGRRLPAHVRKPQVPAIRTRVDAYGIDIELFPCSDGVDLVTDAKLTRAAAALSAAWGGQLSWTPRPGGGWVVRLALTAPNPNPPVQAVTADPTRLWCGRDERTEPVHLDFSVTPSVGIHGDSVRASRFVASLLAQMAANPDVLFIVCDGKTPDPRTGDYGFLAGHPRARLFGDDIGAARARLAEVVAHRRQRAALMLPGSGNTDFWATGPQPDCPLIVLVLDGYDTYLAGATAAARANRDAVRDLIILGGRAGIAVLLTANASIPKKGLGEHLSARIAFDSATAALGTTAAARRRATTNAPGMAHLEHHLTGTTRFRAAALSVAMAEAVTDTYPPRAAKAPALGLPPASTD
ncbi:hypothetical protein [Nocardia suismassiliense]|uniref:hypothetical protein n=1 Tax=Nocardia suismassiliense TaxID=2077092 RepID=UPI00131F2FE3|nr:hypothetical protein [Nocardia suismassiliense]